MKRPLTLLGVSILVLGMLGCEALRYYPNMINPEPWQVLDPGTPRERFPTPKMITEGGGPTIAPGDLVQLHIRSKSQVPGRLWNDWGNWWIWVGFRTQSDTSFFSTEPRVASALLGLREGDVLEFIEAGDQPGTDSRIAGTLLLNVFGDQSYYKWRKNVEGGSADIYVTTAGTPSQIEIKRVCKGKAQYRTVRLFDDSPVQRCTWAPLQCSMTREPREGWVDEAKIEAVCQDGRTAIFQFGPVASRNGKEWTGPINPYNYFTEWEKKAWKNLPTGVQIAGNRAPEIDRFYELSTVASKPLAIPFLAKLKDPDGDQVYVKVLRKPTHGTLVEQPLGVWTYTPVPNWLGEDEFRFKASDGILESGEARVAITVTKAVGN